MPHQFSLVPTAALLATLFSVINATPGFDCAAVVSNKVRWNLKELGGARSVHWIREEEPSIKNFTFTVNICTQLPRHKGVPAADECPGGTRVCGIDSVYNTHDNVTLISSVVPIAGDYHLKTGIPLDSEVLRLKGSGSHADADKEGLRVELSGGSVPLKKGGKKQKAIIEFLCDPSTDGTDTEKDDTPPSDEETESLSRRADEKDDDKKENAPPLKFITYKDEKVGKDEEEWGVLRLSWRTKYACEDAINQPLPSDGSSWGFFTWFIIILFLAVASYLIFGSWLNYNRYGARGWDLLPHGDTIRDIPYIMKDFGRRVVTTVQGGGSRGGYSAV